MPSKGLVEKATLVCGLLPPFLLSDDETSVRWLKTAVESGVDERVKNKFPDAADVKYGTGSVAYNSDRKKIFPEEGGEYDARGR